MAGKTKQIKQHQLTPAASGTDYNNSNNFTHFLISVTTFLDSENANSEIKTDLFNLLT